MMSLLYMGLLLHEVHLLFCYLVAEAILNFYHKVKLDLGRRRNIRGFGRVRELFYAGGMGNQSEVAKESLVIERIDDVCKRSGLQLLDSCWRSPLDLLR